MLIWGVGWSSAKVLAGYGDPILLVAFRFTISLISLIPVMLVLKIPLSISSKNFFMALLAGVFLTLFNQSFFLGLKNGQAGHGGIVITTISPLLSYVIDWTYHKRKPSLQETTALSIGFIAMLILLKTVNISDTPFSLSTLEISDLYFLAAALSWAILGLITSKVRNTRHPLTFAFWSFTVPILWFILFTPTNEINNLIQRGDLLFWGNLFYFSVGAVTFGTSFYFYASTQIGNSRTAAFQYIVPLAAGLGAWIFLNEQIEGHTIVGGSLAVFSAILAMRSKHNARP